MKLVIVGGVAAGASTAARARRLDEKAEIVMLERGQHVSFANCGLPYHIGGVIRDRDRLLLQTPESLKSALNLDVRVGHEVVAIDRGARSVSVRRVKDGSVYAEPYDKLVLCPGALPLVPPLPGVDHPRVCVLRNIEDMDRIKAAVDGGARGAVVIGAGYIGVEMAESLAHRGLDVDVVEMVDQIMPPLDREMTRELESHMAARGVRLHLGTAAAAFREQGDRLAVELVNGTVLTTDLVILSAGVRPDSSLAKAAGLAVGQRGGIKVNEHLQTSDPDIYAAGDAVEVVHSVTRKPVQLPLAGPANRQGRAVADHIFGRAGGYRGTMGTAIVKIFDMTAGGTGASEKYLKAEGIPYRKIYLHPSGHAGYYPGTAPMHMKVMFAPETGKLLGAQVVGFDGVDKRLDVLATALYGGLTVQDLQHLELAYAPPYGSAKDPVNMAGFVGSNLLSGDLEVWHAEDYPLQTSRGVILDVRGGQEYEGWHIPGAVNLPLGKLRASLGQLDRGRPVFVYCKVGFRSYLAYRILRQNGFEVRTLSGGSLTFVGHHGASLGDGQPQPPAEPYPDARAEARMRHTSVDLDLRGLQCPGPIRKLAEAAQALKPGDELSAVASDPGYAKDGPAWCRRQGHEVLSVETRGAETTLRLRKGAACAAAAAVAGATRPARDKKTMVVFSGDLDKVLAAFVIANGALSMGSEVTMFFTFWGLNALRKDGPQAAGKGLLDRMFGWMMPAGARRLKLSNMNMLGMGTAMMKHVMRTKRVDSLPELMAQAMKGGVKMVACSMSMDVMGLKREELIDGLEIGGVASFLGEADEAGMTLFI
jgi:NADPH-dependent 2,4-dienoyl-CoA reductase/sulfur reductase-like enzyme/peroxiredoxin family protein/rhodanese-related sulfurtransferase/TusA-related sulfurtransferase